MLRSLAGRGVLERMPSREVCAGVRVHVTRKGETERVSQADEERLEMASRQRERHKPGSLTCPICSRATHMLKGTAPSFADWSPVQGTHPAVGMSPSNWCDALS